MKKKLLAILSLVCSAVICASVGTVLLMNNGKTIAHAGDTYTKVVNGTTYTFVADPDAWHSVEVGDMTGLNSAAATGINNPLTEYYSQTNNKYWTGNFTTNESGIYSENATFFNTAYGAQFRFKTDNAWYSPAVTRNDTGAEWISAGIMQIFYGNLTITFNTRENTTHMVVTITCNGVGNLLDFNTAKNMSNACFKDFFASNVIHPKAANGYSQEGNKAKMNYWVDVKLSTCPTTDGAGFWFKLSVKDSIVYDAFVPCKLYTTGGYFDDFSISNKTIGKAVTTAMTYRYPEEKDYRNNLLITRINKLVVGQETYKDIADFGKYTDEYVMGYTPSTNAHYSITANDRPLLVNGAQNGSVGFEFRMKQNDTHDSFMEKAVAAGVTNNIPGYFFSIRCGHSLLWAQYNAGAKTLQLNPGVWEGSYKKTLNATNVIANYEIGAEYVWRVTRNTVDTADGKEKGSIVRVYVGKIDTATNMPTSNWDSKPALEYYDTYARSTTAVSANGIYAQATNINNNVNGAHTITFSSNKYVGVKTNVDGVETINKLDRGSDFTFGNVSNGSTVHVGWSEGASAYSAADFHAVGSKLENVTVSDPTVYKALTMTLTADKAASLKFRQRMVDGQYLPMEASLKWNVNAEDYNNLATYFGGIKFGYKLMAENGKSYEAQVENVTDGYTEPYAFSIIQSNIDEASYTMKFACQAYVEFADGIKVYSENVDVATEGRSVDMVADAAAADLKAAEEGYYYNEIKDASGNVIGYSYLTQKQYDLIAKISAINE